MELYVISFKGDLVVQAESEKAARKRAEQWIGSWEDKLPDASVPAITAINVSVYQDHVRKGSAKKKAGQDADVGEKKESKKPRKK